MDWCGKIFFDVLPTPATILLAEQYEDGKRFFCSKPNQFSLFQNEFDNFHVLFEVYLSMIQPQHLLTTATLVLPRR